MGVIEDRSFKIDKPHPTQLHKQIVTKNKSLSSPGSKDPSNNIFQKSSLKHIA
jgi:hypothetical protein